MAVLDQRQGADGKPVYQVRVRRKGTPPTRSEAWPMRKPKAWDPPCPNPACSHYRLMNLGHMSAIATYLTQSGQRRIFHCSTCESPFSEPRDTVVFALRTAEEKRRIPAGVANEPPDTWKAFFGELYLKGVTEATTDLVVSDGANGLESVLDHHLYGVAYQRYMLHKIKQLADHLVFGELQVEPRGDDAQATRQAKRQRKKALWAEASLLRRRRGGHPRAGRKVPGHVARARTRGSGEFFGRF